MELNKEQEYLLRELEKMFRERNAYFEQLAHGRVSEAAAKEGIVEYTFAGDKVLDDRLAAYEHIKWLVESRLKELKDEPCSLTEAGLGIWDGSIRPWLK